MNIIGIRTCSLQLLFSLLGILQLGAAAAGETVTYYHTDALGTPVMESNQAGVVTYTREHEPYGGQVLGTPKNGPGFTGHVDDAGTGLVYMQARYFDPTMNRFLSSDPVSPDFRNGANYNRYWYANNNPFKFTDPDGKKAYSGHLCDFGCEMGSFIADDRGSPSGAQDKSLEGAAVGEKAANTVAKINNAIEAAKGRIAESGDQKAIDDWNKTTWKWDPGNPVFEKNPDIAAFRDPKEPYVIRMGGKSSEIYSKYVNIYHSARFPGGEVGMQFLVLHEFAHVFTAGQGTPGKERENMANKAAYLWMARGYRRDIKCRLCID